MPRLSATDGPGGVALPAAELAGRFAADLDRLVPAGDRLGLAVSGGPDSLALLLLAAAVRPGLVEAATVDHGLRPESAAEAAMVADLCARIGVPHAILPVTLADGNLQAEARGARYAALAGWMEQCGLAALATAHHADDQAETLLMRLNRASGVAGLAGVRARGPVPGTRLPLVRPLLEWRRAELALTVVEAGLSAVDDPSNAADRFDRVRLRKALATADWIDVPSLARSAAHIGDADVAIEWAARREWDEAVSKAPMGLTYRPQAPRAIALRVMMRIIAELDGEQPRGGAVGRVLDALVAGQPASIGSLVARPGRDGWTFTQAPRRRS